MKALLMYKDRDFGYTQYGGRDLDEIRYLRHSNKPASEFSESTAALVQDLELEMLFRAMASGDPFLFEVAKKAVLSPLSDSQEIIYRQEILKDSVARSQIVRSMYGIAVEAIERERQVWGWSLRSSPRAVLHRSVEVLQIFVKLIVSLRRISDEHGTKFQSPGFLRLFNTITTELSDEYMSTVKNHLRMLGFRDGVLLSAEITEGAKSANYILRKPWEENLDWKERLHGWMKSQFSRDPRLVYEVDPRDEAGARALDDIRTLGIGHVAGALAESTEHILDFFKMLRAELGFYVGCLNLHEQISRKGEPFCFPEPDDADHLSFSAQGLYDIALSLTVSQPVVGNNVMADHKNLVMITGANRGGKSTFLRSVGLAQLMMQAGMFAPANFFRANLCNGIFTHFKREEDVTMKSGKLDEELARINSVVEKVSSNSIVLFNESFASTNEREGSEIARQIVRALLEQGIKVFYVTHLFDLAHSFDHAQFATLFLRAERLPNGTRTFRMTQGEPLPTSYGGDLYRRIFDEAGPMQSPPAF